MTCSSATHKEYRSIEVISVLNATAEGVIAKADIRGDAETVSLSFKAVELNTKDAESVYKAYDELVRENMSGSTVVWNNPMGFDGSRVVRVLVNLNITPIDEEEKEFKDMKVLGLVSGIVGACRGLFPNMQPKECGFNVHSGAHHYFVDRSFYKYGTNVHPLLFPQ